MSSKKCAFVDPSHRDPQNSDLRICLKNYFSGMQRTNSDRSGVVSDLTEHGRFDRHGRRRR